MVNCLLCGKEYGSISEIHLRKKHNGMTSAEYMLLDGAKLWDGPRRKLKVPGAPHAKCAREDCDNLVKRVGTLYCDRLCRGTVEKRIRAVATHCTNGHELTEENIRYDKKGNWVCKVCHRGWSSKFKSKYEKPDHASHILRTFGLTIEDYEAILDAQDGACAICLQPPGKMNLSVDHCHKTGMVRGLLCQLCNLALGQFGDNLQKLRSACYYLEDYGVVCE